MVGDSSTTLHGPVPSHPLRGPSGERVRDVLYNGHGECMQETVESVTTTSTMDPSVRQLIDESGLVGYAAAYEPYGEVLYAVGEAQSVSMGRGGREIRRGTWRNPG